jgi:hypothetical protein
MVKGQIFLLERGEALVPSFLFSACSSGYHLCA